VEVTTPISRTLVKGYIKAARPNAKTPSEKAALAEALTLVGIERRRSVAGRGGGSGAEWKAKEWVSKWQRERLMSHRSVYNYFKPTEPETEVAKWKFLILNELHIALCTRKRKYGKEVAALKQNAGLLIGAIAGYVAALIGGVAAAVIAALVAALLRFVLVLGVGVFCERWKPR
jgi:hypothetical protein